MPTIAAAILLVLVLLGAAGEAVAHASLRASTPPDGATLDQPPERIELRFSEPVAALAIRLETAAGGSVPVAVAPAGDGARLIVTPTEALARGSYLLRWRVASVDGHPVAGRIAFAIGAIPTIGPAEPESAGAALLLARTLHLATILLGGGTVSALLLLPLGPAAAVRSARLARGLLLAALPVTVFRLAATGLEAGGLPATALFGAEPWRAALATGAFPGLATSATGCVLLLALLGRGKPPLVPAALGVLLAAAGFGFGGHAATATPVAVFAPAVVLHVLLAMVWLGAFAPLLVALRSDPAPTARRVVERFSDRALLLVPLLLAIGTVLAMRQLPEGVRLADSLWSRILLLKLALVGGLLVIAWVNRTRLLPRLAAGQPGAGRILGPLLWLDLGLAVLVLAATAALGTTPPPRLLPAEEAQEVHINGPALAVRLELRPGRAGWNRIALRLDPPEPTPLEVRLLLRPDDGSSEHVEALARRGEDGIHRTDPLLLVPAGTWRLAIGVLLDPFTRVELDDRLLLP